MENKIIPTTNANEVVKQELANKNALELTTTDNKLVASRLQALDILGSVIKENLKEGINDDYAVIPNTSKPALLQAGADKICLLYGITKEFPIMNIDQDKKMVTCKCELYYQGMKVGESYGASAIGTQRDIGWELNKAIKIAQKRAKVGAVVGIANLSKIFTQDTEDMEPVKEYTQEQKNKTYEVSKWFYKHENLFFTRKTAKDCWAKFVDQFNKMVAWKKHEGIKSVYELGCDPKLIIDFKESVETKCGTEKPFVVCTDFKFEDNIGTELKKEGK